MDTNTTMKIEPHNPLDSLDEYIKGLVHDSPHILADLIRMGVDKYSTIEFYAECPEQPRMDLYIALFNRWEEISIHLQSPIRVYTYLYNNVCEDFIQSLAQAHPNIHVTVLPGYLRKAETINA